jgi:hypothetical protein
MNLLLCEHHLLALREFGAVTIEAIDDIQIGDIYFVSDKSLAIEFFDVTVVDVTDTSITLVAVRS